MWVLCAHEAISQLLPNTKPESNIFELQGAGWLFSSLLSNWKYNYQVICMNIITYLHSLRHVITEEFSDYTVPPWKRKWYQKTTKKKKKMRERKSVWCCHLRQRIKRPSPESWWQVKTITIIKTAKSKNWSTFYELWSLLWPSRHFILIMFAFLIRKERFLCLSE
jgi:hypothetical protein